MRLIAVVGAAPGVGKSTLCAGLVAHLRRTGRKVEHFDEPDVLTRPEFAHVAAEFALSRTVIPEVLVADTVDYLRSAMADGVDVVVCDALMPYVPSLIASGYGEDDIAATVGCLAKRVADIPVLVVYVDGSPEVALPRAASREGGDWLAWFGRKLAGFRLVPEQPDMADLVAYLAYERDVTMRVLDASSWLVAIIPDGIAAAPADVLEAVLGYLE